MSSLHVDQPLETLSCVVFDLETTGFSNEDRIVEIAAVRLDEWTPTGELNTLVNPQTPISARSQSVHKIDESMLTEAPTFQEIAPQFANLIEHSVLVGHNIFSFDLRFVLSHTRKVFGAGPNNWAIDTLMLARRLMPDAKSHKLESLANHFGIPIIAHHAMSDVYANAELWLRLSSLLMQRGYRKLGDLERFKALRRLDGSGLPTFDELPPVRLTPR